MRFGEQEPEGQFNRKQDPPPALQNRPTLYPHVPGL